MGVSVTSPAPFATQLISSATFVIHTHKHNNIAQFNKPFHPTYMYIKLNTCHTILLKMTIFANLWRDIVAIIIIVGVIAYVLKKHQTAPSKVMRTCDQMISSR